MNKFKNIILVVLLLIIAFQFLISRVRYKEIISIELLNKLNANNEEILTNKKTMSGDNEAFVIKAEEINNLINFCLRDNNNDSIEKLKKNTKELLPNIDDEYLGIYNNLSSEDLKLREKSLAFLKYLTTNQIIINMTQSNYQIDNVGVKCFPEINKDNTIMLGENYITNIVFVANNTLNPIKVRIEGDNKEYIMDPDLLKIRYVRPSLSRGEKEFKGELIYNVNGEEIKFPFNQKYTVK